MRIALIAFAYCLLAACTKPVIGPGADAKAGTSCHTEMVTMRDGIKLATDIYMPATPGLHPVVVMRNPYGRTLGTGCGATMTLRQMESYIKDGYVAISQDVRGTSRSEGSFTPFLQEQNDGYDLVEWAASQSWSVGKVSLIGGSYLGAALWQAAISGPPHLVAIAPAITAADYHDDWVYRNAVFDPSFTMNWVAGSFVGDQIIRDLSIQGLDRTLAEQGAKDWKTALTANIDREWRSVLPLSGNWSPTFKHYAPFYFEWLRHPSYDKYWATIDVGQHYDKVAVPALISGGWYDLFAVGSIDSYLGMHHMAGTNLARRGSMLAMSWGGHAAFTPSAPGRIDWGPDPSDSTLTQRFIDHYSNGADNGIERDPHVQLVVLVPPDRGTTGSSFLFKTDDFPVPGTRWSRYFLRSGGRANSRTGDGMLDQRDASGKADRFIYDPGNPVPTTGGNDEWSGRPAGAYDQTEIEKRGDVLVYRSSVLTEDTAVIGPVTVSLWAMSSAPDTDFTAKLVDLHPDGFAHNVLDRIIRARYRSGSKSPPSPIKPNKPYDYEIPLGATATVFRKGHRIVLEISSSSFPHYGRNLNTGLSNEDTVSFVSAKQTILHDPTHPSHLTLPIVICAPYSGR